MALADVCTSSISLFSLCKSLRNMSLNLFATALLFIIVALAISRLRSRNKPPLPPGPKGWPLIGHLRAAAVDKHKYWYQLGQQYGPLSSVKVANLTFIIINSHDVAHDLIVKRFANYSGRARLPFIELLDESAPWTSKLILTRQYGPEYRLHRRMLESGMTATYADRFHGLMELETCQLVNDLLVDKDCRTVGISSVLLFKHIERVQTSFVIGGTYGFRTPHRLDPNLVTIIKSSHDSNDIAVSQTLLNFFPVLKSLPKFLSPYYKAAAKVRDYTAPWVHGHLITALERPGWNLAKQSYAIGMKDGSTPREVEVNLESNVYGGVETSPRELMWVVVAAITQRTSVRKVQAQLDEVVGPNRLPNFIDRPKLTYVDAFLREVMRWRPIMADSIPHRVESDDIYNGYLIPANALIMPNAWGINRDTKYFGDDVEEFIPERWFTNRDVKNGSLRHDLPTPVFGYGRRTCAGKRIAEDGMYMQMARLLWAFDFKEVDGEPVNPNADLRHTFTVPPAPFKVKLMPRRTSVRDVVTKEWRECETDVPKLLGQMDEKYLSMKSED
ncbi:cytochrome P450 [Aspergillus puulaauensis]|uniref:Cytochrome P450 n=1 Tax=Aspergillus puulaauensis TaxID=1220207 RepID=A0A7R8AJV0_9EURO|nr:uncharacterized protein APUU_21968A [Aspergillus puulaauensis]BCS21536.1 hypothetical protein APUU_21968A [Aspergillus puulaauensis]